MTQFDELLKYLREVDQPGPQLHPGFMPNQSHKTARVLAEQIEANRLAIQELHRKHATHSHAGNPFCSGTSTPIYTN